MSPEENMGKLLLHSVLDEVDPSGSKTFWMHPFLRQRSQFQQLKARQAMKAKAKCAGHCNKTRVPDAHLQFASSA